MMNTPKLTQNINQLDQQPNPSLKPLSKEFIMASRKRLAEKPFFLTSDPHPLKQELITAAQKGELNTIQRLLDQNIHPDSVSMHTTALNEAISNGQIKAMELLINAGANVQGKELGESPLMVATRNNQITAMEILLNKGATKSVTSLLIEASSHGHTEAIEVLIANFEIDERAASEGLTAASRHGKIEAMNLLINKFDNLKLNLKHAFILTASNGQIEAMQLLIAHGANLDIITNEEAFKSASRNGKIEAMQLLIDTKTPISDTIINKAFIQAASNGHINAMQLLIAHGANLDMIANEAFIQAASNNHIDTMQLLMNNGANFDATTKTKALIAASFQKHPKAMKLLIDNGADVNAEDKDVVKNDLGGSSVIPTTPLMAAAGYVNDQVHSWGDNNDNINTHGLQLLIDHGAGVNIQDKDGKTALILAATYGRREDSIEMLIQNKADVNIQDKDGNTALIKAASFGSHSLATIKLLIEAGTDLNLTNNYGNTALMRASEGYTPYIVKLLIEHGAALDITNKAGKTALMMTKTPETINLLTLASKVDQLISGEQISDISDSQGNLFLEFFKARATLKGISSYDAVTTALNNSNLSAKITDSISNFITDQKDQFAHAEISEMFLLQSTKEAEEDFSDLANTKIARIEAEEDFSSLANFGDFIAEVVALGDMETSDASL